jgi:hypothetical protein
MEEEEQRFKRENVREWELYRARKQVRRCVRHLAVQMTHTAAQTPAYKSENR